MAPREPSRLSRGGQAALAGVGALLLALMWVGTPHPANAQDIGLGKPIKVDRTKPMLLHADELVYDNKNQRVTAIGNVEVYFNNYTLLADKLIYFQAKKRLIAIGNVRIIEPSGSIVNADRIELNDDFRDGFIKSLRIVTKEDARIAAARARRVDGGATTIFERGVFTPCKECKKHPDRPPLWQLRAVKIIHKKEEGNIYYEDASLEFFGVPVAYFPYFFHPDPSVKRRSGFLIPSVGQSTDLGFTLEIPYYYVISPSSDITLSPMITTKQGILVKGIWRQRLSTGAYDIEFAGIHQNDAKEGDSVSNDWRGSVVTRGRFNLGSWWYWGWDATLESDDTFRRFYKLDNISTTDRVSKLFLIGQSERNYFSAFMYHFGGLTAVDTSTTESRAHPSIDYSYYLADPVLGGEVSFKANALSLSRDDGADTNRLIAELRWRKQIIDNMGQVFTPFAHLRGDVYKVSNYDGGSGKDSLARGMATGGLQYSLPLVAYTPSGAHIIEPIAQIIARPDSVKQTDVPNEDAQSLVFDDTLLFDIDKFSGYDRLETGVRANYGIRYIMQMKNGGHFRFLFGQSYHISGENPFAAGTGLSSDRSDYVAGLAYAPHENLRVQAQSRFDTHTLELRRQDLYAFARYGPFYGSVNYALTKRVPALGIPEDEQEVILSGSLKLTDFWSVFAGFHYDIEDSRRISDYAGVSYSDECFVLSVQYKESFVEDRDIDPDRSVLVRFELKHLGGTQFETGVVGDLVSKADSR